MEPVSLALGVLPLVGGAVQVSTSVHQKFKIFRHYNREVKRIQKHLDRQQQFFTNETHLLLRLAVDDERLIERMLEDGEHPQWRSEELELGLRDALRKSLEQCKEVIEDVREALTSLHTELDCFDELVASRNKDEKLKDAVRRLRGRVKVTLDKSKCEAHIKSLREAVDDLRRIREQAVELNKPAPATTCAVAVAGRAGGLRQQLSQEYRQYTTVRRASKAFHQALSLAWSRTSAETQSATAAAGELRHTVKLFLDTKVQNEVSMDVAIMCYGHDLNKKLMQASLTRLRVKSQMLDWLPLETGLNTPATSTDGASDDGTGARKRRKVQFAESLSPPQAAPPAVAPLSPSSSTTTVYEGPPHDLLCAQQDICSVLGRCGDSPCAEASSARGAAECLGYIDTNAQENFRHSFYAGFKDRSEQQALFQGGLISMDEVLGHAAETSLSVVDQLKLARNLVSAVLKFYSTPWLGDYFSLGDLSFFRLRQDLSGCLQTLHVGFEFVQGCSAKLASVMEGVVEEAATPNSSAEGSSAIEAARLQYGVRNLTLWSLGTILLQIGMWSRVVRADDVLSVRKLCAQTPSLGPRYQELTKRCLECDFGYGDDLSKPRLQQAVYEGLVCELNDMIGSLDINRD